MKRNSVIVFSLSLLMYSYKVNAQFDFDPQSDTNYYAIKNRFYSDTLNFGDSLEEGGRYANFKRWESFWDNRIGSDGSFNSIAQKLHNYIDNSGSLDIPRKLTHLFRGKLTHQN